MLNTKNENMFLPSFQDMLTIYKHLHIDKIRASSGSQNLTQDIYSTQISCLYHQLIE